MRYFFFDVDGTLLPFGKEIPESTRAALRLIRENGSRSFLATGRSLIEIPGAVKALGFDGGVYSAGATVVADGRTVFRRRMSEEECGTILEFCHSHGFRLLMQSDDGTYISEEDLRYWQSLLYKHVGRLLDIPGLKATYEIPSSIIKLLYICNGDGVDVEDVAAEVPEGFSVVANTVGLPSRLMGEIVLSDITKATGIDAVLNCYGGSINEAVAIGDGANDIEMVQHAGLGVAMGNADASLKAVADIRRDGEMEEQKRRKAEYRSSIRSKLLIRNALVSLMREKPFEKITVTDIVKRADINRGTFYAHYKDSRQVLDKIREDALEEVGKALRVVSPDRVIENPEPVLAAASEFLNRDISYYRMLVSVIGVGGLLREIRGIISDYLGQSEIVRQAPDKTRTACKLDFIIAGIAVFYYDVVTGASSISLEAAPSFLSDIIKSISDN